MVAHDDWQQAAGMRHLLSPRAPIGNPILIQCMRTAVAALRRLLCRPSRELAPTRDLPELSGPAAALMLRLLEATMPPSVLAEAAAVHASMTSSTDGSSGSQAAALQRPKSAKRRASEAALERRFSSSDLVAAAAAGGDHAAKRLREERPAVRVAACSDCSGRAEADVDEAEQAAAWCAQDVALPPMDWAAALQSVQSDADMAYDRVAGCYTLPGAFFWKTAWLERHGSDAQQLLLGMSGQSRPAAPVPRRRLVHRSLLPPAAFC